MKEEVRVVEILFVKLNEICVFILLFFPSYYKILYKYFYLLLMNYQFFYSLLQQGVHLFNSTLYLCCVHMCVIKLN